MFHFQFDQYVQCRHLAILRIVVLYLKHLAGFLIEKPALFRRMCRRCIDAAAASFRGLFAFPPPPAVPLPVLFSAALFALSGGRRSAAEILLLKA